MTVPRQLRSPAAAALAVAALVAVAAAAVLLLRPGGADGPPDAAAVGARLVFAEYGPAEDRIYVAPAGDLEDRVVVAQVAHARGWALTPAREMAGSLAAFTALPSDAAPRRDAPAGVWLLDLATGEQARLARDADLLAAPVLDREGRALAYRRTRIDGVQELVRVDLASRARRVLLEAATDFGIFPVAFARDGSLVYAELSTAGTHLRRVAGDGGGGAALVAHASAHVARDWRLSPDGRSLSFLAPEIEAERVVHRLRVVALDGRDASAPVPPDALAGDQFSPVWTPGGDGITVGREPGFAAGAPPLTLFLGGGDAPALAAPGQGFDAPLGWSADGRWLAARSFEGRDASAPGRESLVVLSSAGGRATVRAARDLIFIGWLQDG